MIMSLLEYTALRVGVVPRPERNLLLWSGLTAHSPGSTSTYTQRLAGHNYTLRIDPSGSFTGALDETPLFEAKGGLRVLTDLNGTVTELWGIANTSNTVTVRLAGGGVSASPSLTLTLAPNEEWQVDLQRSPPTAKLVRKVPYYAPYD